MESIKSPLPDGQPQKDEFDNSALLSGEQGQEPESIRITEQLALLINTASNARQSLNEIILRLTNMIGNTPSETYEQSVFDEINTAKGPFNDALIKLGGEIVRKNLPRFVQDETIVAENTITSTQLQPSIPIDEELGNFLDLASRKTTSEARLATQQDINFANAFVTDYTEQSLLKVLEQPSKELASVLSPLGLEFLEIYDSFVEDNGNYIGIDGPNTNTAGQETNQ